MPSSPGRHPRTSSAQGARPIRHTRRRRRAVFAELARLCRRAGSRRRAGCRRAPTGWRVNAWVKQGILLGFRWGGLARRVHGPRPLAVRGQGHAAAEASHDRRRRARRARRIVGPRRRVPRARRDLHAADVHQHRRVGWRGHARRLARARRLVRADRRARAPERGCADRRRDRAGRSAAGHHRRRRARRREYRRVRRRRREDSGRSLPPAP